MFSGGGTSLEASVGKSVRAGLIVGGLWQFVAVTDPNESYRGTTYVVSGTDRFLNVVAAFMDYYPNPRRGLHVGGSAGLLVTSNLDRYRQMGKLGAAYDEVRKAAESADAAKPTIEGHHNFAIMACLEWYENAKTRHLVRQIAANPSSN